MREFRYLYSVISSAADSYTRLNARVSLQVGNGFFETKNHTMTLFSCTLIILAHFALFSRCFAGKRGTTTSVQKDFLHERDAKRTRKTVLNVITPVYIVCTWLLCFYIKYKSVMTWMPILRQRVSLVDGIGFAPAPHANYEYIYTSPAVAVCLYSTYSVNVKDFGIHTLEMIVWMIK